MAAEANNDLVAAFYTSFTEHDGAAMAACYAPDAHFWDPVFRDLHGDEPGQMWRMLTGRAPDLEIELVSHEADETKGTAHWKATYTFSQTGRHVTNDVRATFRFEDGLIADHRDEFDFYKWSRQALGPIGAMLGWTALLRSATHKKARAGLDSYIAAQRPEVKIESPASTR